MAAVIPAGIADGRVLWIGSAGNADDLSQQVTTITRTTRSPDLDAIIVGGGVAGLWLLNQLTHDGHQCLLFESGALGGEQTLASQGMVHGGIKYTLGGALTGASEAIADMPARWRQALAGQGPVDLSGLKVLADRYYLFAEGNSLGKLTGFFASKALRGRIERLQPADYPAGLNGFDGVVYGLPDFVVDARQLLEQLQKPVTDRTYQLEVNGENLGRTDDDLWSLQLPEGEPELTARRLILCAGAGNGPLIDSMNLSQPKMQLRPLHQVLVWHPDLTPLYAHCVTGIRRPEPRLTITSHEDGQGRVLWYLGGAIATTGIKRSTAAQIAAARKELSRCVPWLDWSKAEFETLRIDRAEPVQLGGSRPDEAYLFSVSGHDDAAGLNKAPCHVCWPTKLSLAPDLADRVSIEMKTDETPQTSGRDISSLPLPTAVPGRPPWVHQ